jgi:hypothetical protein
MPAPKPNRKRALSADRRRALELLVDFPNGCHEGFMLAHGFTPKLLADLIGAGLATATTERVAPGNRPIEVTRMQITYAGRQRLATES